MESPLVAVLSSAGVDHRITSRGLQSVAHLLAPFATHGVDVRDPSGQTINAKITVDFRDIRKQGHLLSLSVLPFVLQEALGSSHTLDEALSNYSECLAKFAEPNDYETLRTFIACIFIVSSGEENPLVELSQLIQLQHTQQHSTAENKNLGPAHCATPKWTTPNTLKYYVLLHDMARDDEAKSIQCFNQMCTTYGVDSCQLLKIGLGANDGLQDVWQKLDFLDRLLEKGLVRALQHVQDGQDRKDTTPSSVATITPSFSYSQPSLNLPKTDNPNPQRLISAEDREACSKMIETFLRNSLIPHAERLMRTLNDQLSDRRTIGKSLTSGMKKWFGGGSTQNTVSTMTSYTSESGEMKSRRLADIAYQFGLYAFAHAQYRAVKKEFENDQAWLYHAVALELSAIALRFSAPELTAKQFPMRYLEEAMKHLLNSSPKYSMVMRCAIHAGKIMADLEQPREAANLLAQVASLDNDHCVGVAQVHAARFYQDAGMERKSAFYYVLAGNRFMKGGIQSVALECYRLALGHYFAKQWDSIEDHLCYIISSQSSDKRLAVDCAARLLRSSLWQSEADQNRFVENFMQKLEKFGPADQSAELPIPHLCSYKTRTICGERPLSTDVVPETGIEWMEIRRGAFHAVAGSSSPFRSLHLVSDNDTDNKTIRETPPGERFRVIITLENPLIIPLHLKDLHLIGDFQFTEGAPAANQPFASFDKIESLELSPGEKKEIELAVLPSETVKSIKIEGIAMKINGKGKEVIGRLQLTIRGKRLNRNANDMKKVTYAEDNRLFARISTKKWPLLDFRAQKLSHSSQVYCSQAYRIKIDISNIGFETVDSIVMATDAMDCIAVEMENTEQEFCTSSLAASNNSIRIYRLSAINTGSSTSLIVNIRAPLIQTTKTVALLFFYHGVSGSYREWRHVVEISPASLIQTEAKVLDPRKGMVQLDIKNAIPKATNAEIAEIDILKIQAVKQQMDQKGEYKLSPLELNLTPMKMKPVHLENGQSASICILMTTTKMSPTNCVWLAEKQDSPHWPLPQPTGETLPASERLLSVLWRSNIVDQAGFKSIIHGEMFVPCPFKAASLAIAGIDDEEDISSPLAINCQSLEILQHDFKNNRLCELPLKFHVYNQDRSKRTATVTISFAPKVAEAVDAVSQVAPDSRQLWWPDKLVSRAKIPYGTEYIFNFNIKVTQPSVYDLGGGQFRIDGRFSDSELLSFPAPNSLVIVNSV